LRPASTTATDSDSDTTSDSDEREVAFVKPSSVAARAAAVSATGNQQQKTNQVKRLTLANAPQNQKQISERNQESEKTAPPKSESKGTASESKGTASKNNSNNSNSKRRQQKRGGKKPAPEQKSVPLKNEAPERPDNLVEPLKRAMSSDLIPVDEGSKPKKTDAASNNDNNDAQAKTNQRSFSIMDDGWGV